MEKTDLSRQYRDYFKATTSPQIVIIEPAQFISIAGEGDPANEKFAEAIQALYTTAYTVKSICKSLQKDFVVSKLEGLWWFDEARYGNPSIAEAPQMIPREGWQYRLLIRLPIFVTAEMISTAVDTVVSGKQMQRAEGVKWFSMSEGSCVQILHVGPFATEPESLLKIDTLIKAKGLAKNGLHHEIYLSDFRKTAPEKLKTILREPVK